MLFQTKPTVAVSSGINLDKAEQIAIRLNCEVAHVRRTGEVRFRHPLMPRPCRVNSRRRCAPRHLVVWLRRLIEVQASRLP
jgi:hypothetical protein